MCGRGRAAGDATGSRRGRRGPSTAPPGRRRPARDTRRRESGTLAASASTSAELLDDAQAVAQPLHDRPGDEDRAFQAIGDLAVESPADRRQQLVLRRDRLRRRCSAAGSSRCRRCSWRCRARSRPGRTWPPAGRRRTPAIGNRPAEPLGRSSGRRLRSTGGPRAAWPAECRGSAAVRRPNRACGC